jgi:L-ribulose-5-phosphate 3-epimerase
MIKSISHWAFSPDRPLPEVFSMARDLGFPAVEVTIAEEGPITPETTAAQCEEIVEAASSAGVTLSSLASGFGWSTPVTCEDAEVRKRGIELTAASLRVARDLGLDAILLVPGGVAADFIPGFQGAPYDVAYDNALAALRELKGVAEEMGVTIGVENVWNKFLLSPLELRDFLDKVGSPRAASYFDVGNVVASGYPEQWIRILGPRIARVHFKDFKRDVATLDGFCDLLDGDTDYGAVMNALREIGYDGFVTAEFFDVEADLPKISAAMDTILKM